MVFSFFLPAKEKRHLKVPEGISVTAAAPVPQQRRPPGAGQRGQRTRTPPPAPARPAERASPARRRQTRSGKERRRERRPLYTLQGGGASATRHRSRRPPRIAPPGGAARDAPLRGGAGAPVAESCGSNERRRREGRAPPRLNGSAGSTASREGRAAPTPPAERGVCGGRRAAELCFWHSGCGPRGRGQRVQEELLAGNPTGLVLMRPKIIAAASRIRGFCVRDPNCIKCPHTEEETNSYTPLLVTYGYSAVIPFIFGVGSTSQNILSWKRPTRITDSWLHTAQPKSQTLCLRVLSKRSLNSGGSGHTPCPRQPVPVPSGPSPSL
ncbi:uncharacterized protein LOC110396396 [Numida meleagris]|uniref:uncharacterized protein LOC110396396 n=1 Tax=Numida meleagris TaxID=8996 RepID=UPI000B3DA725|nr:uncharacterized protein LOC110396396 [Numida meleagris]